MNTFLKLSTAALSLSLVMGCAKTETQKVQDQQQKTADTKAEADKTLAELTTSLPQLRARPEPTEKWTEEELKSYADQLDANERNLNKLVMLNGKDNVQIQGEANLEESRKMINQKRQALQAVRTKRAEQSVTQSKEQKVASLNQAYDTDSNYLEGEGIPTTSWPEEKLVKYEQAVGRVDKTLHELETTAGENVATTLRKAMNQTRKGLVESARKK